MQKMYNRTIKCNFKIIIISAFLICTNLSITTAASNEAEIAFKQGSSVSFITSCNDAEIIKTIHWCQNYLSFRGYLVKSDITSEITIPDKKNSPAWIFELSGNSPIADSLGIDTAFLSSAKSDACILSIFSRNNRTYIAIVGRNSQGIRSGVAKLICKMYERDGKLLTQQATEKLSPFFDTRRIYIGTTGRIAQDLHFQDEFLNRMIKDSLWTNWSDERLSDYAEQLWLFGFNSVEFAELRGYRGSLNDDDLKKITPKIKVFAKAIRDNGMQTSQHIWGDVLFSEGASFSWNNPDERKIMQQEFDRLASTYGDVTDHLLVHIGDPGGCRRDNCDRYKTPQEICTYIHKAYQKYNPDVTITYCTWANEEFWQGYPGVDFLDESFSSKDIAIGLHRWYDADKAKIVTGHGRSADIWCWYMSDFELNQVDMNLSMRKLDKYFVSLPQQASDQIHAISTEICFQGLPHIINAYVTAQKMWNPQRPLEQIEREFCAAMFGQANADAMLKVYQACESYVHPQNYGIKWWFIPQTDCLPIVFGTADYNNQLRQTQAAANTVTLPQNFKPNFTTPATPQDLKTYLFRNLSLISIFSEAAESIITAQINNLPKSAQQQIFNQAIKTAENYTQDPDYNNLVQDVNSIF